MKQQKVRKSIESQKFSGVVCVRSLLPALRPAGTMAARNLSGFTLIEMLVTLSIVSVMAVIVGASFQGVLDGVRMMSEINALQQGMNLARSEAIKRGQSVSVCPGTAASTACGAGNDWSGGWIVFLSSTASPLLVSPGVTHGDTLTSSSVQATPYPTFTAVGYTFFGDKLSLHDRSSTPGLYRCIVFNAGSWGVHTGASCP